VRVSLDISIDERALIAVANTRHGTEAWRPLPPGAHLVARGVVERLRTPDDAVAFLRAFEVVVPETTPTPDDLLRLRDVRECARALAEGDRRGYARRLAKLLADVRLRLGADGSARATSEGWRAFTDALAVALVELDPVRRRVKLCHNSACAWLFIDATKNGSQVWCTAQLCGDRMRVRRLRRRRSA
jgi:predicted RNA-binding Zn ribbon-like protein